MFLKSSGQLSLPIEFLKEPDRNFEKGGRSFYFFDFDDNVIHLPTKIVLFSKTDASEIEISTTDFAAVAHQIGKSGQFAGFELRDDPEFGSYRNFREQPKFGLDEQPLIRDVAEALQNPFLDWRGPSWDFFMHAVNNNRPIAVITARGHHPHTIRRAIDQLVLSRDLDANPNYLSVYPVTHPEIRLRLGDPDNKFSTAQLKKAAIKLAVNDAFECYSQNPHHRFGMSDDDLFNVQLIREAMRELKQSNPENAFFVINTNDRQLIKEEVFVSDPTAAAEVKEQIRLF